MFDAILHIGRVTLRPTSDLDVPGVAAAGRDSSIRELPWFGRDFVDAWAPDWVKRAQKEADAGRSRIFSIINDDAGYVGSVVLLPMTDEAIEIAYWVLPEHRAAGVATEAVQAAVQWIGATLPGVRIWAKTRPANCASQRVLAKCGFRERTRSKFAYFDWMPPER